MDKHHCNDCGFEERFSYSRILCWFLYFQSYIYWWLYCREIYKLWTSKVLSEFPLRLTLSASLNVTLTKILLINKYYKYSFWEPFTVRSNHTCWRSFQLSSWHLTGDKLSPEHWHCIYWECQMCSNHLEIYWCVCQIWNIKYLSNGT